MEILACRGVRKIYGAGAGQVTALDGISLTVEQGEFVAVVGASGFRKIHAPSHFGRRRQADRRNRYGRWDRAFASYAYPGGYFPPKEGGADIPVL